MFAEVYMESFTEQEEEEEDTKFDYKEEDATSGVAVILSADSKAGMLAIAQQFHVFLTKRGGFHGIKVVIGAGTGNIIIGALLALLDNYDTFDNVYTNRDELIAIVTDVYTTRQLKPSLIGLYRESDVVHSVATSFGKSKNFASTKQWNPNNNEGPYIVFTGIIEGRKESQAIIYPDSSVGTYDNKYGIWIHDGKKDVNVVRLSCGFGRTIESIPISVDIVDATRPISANEIETLDGTTYIHEDIEEMLTDEPDKKVTVYLNSLDVRTNPFAYDVFTVFDIPMRNTFLFDGVSLRCISTDNSARAFGSEFKVYKELSNVSFGYEAGS